MLVDATGGTDGPLAAVLLPVSPASAATLATTDAAGRVALWSAESGGAIDDIEAKCANAVFLGNSALVIARADGVSLWLADTAAGGSGDALFSFAAVLSPQGDEPGATVELTGQQTANTVTDARGEARFLNLAPGRYSVNRDDGNRAFDKGSLINNRLALLAEGTFRYQQYGLFARGSAFYDDVYFRDSDNDSQATLNRDGSADRFSDRTRDRLGARARMLDLYGFAALPIGDKLLDVRVGNQQMTGGELAADLSVGFAELHAVTIGDLAGGHRDPDHGGVGDVVGVGADASCPGGGAAPGAGGGGAVPA